VGRRCDRSLLVRPGQPASLQQSVEDDGGDKTTEELITMDVSIDADCVTYARFHTFVFSATTVSTPCFFVILLSIDYWWHRRIGATLKQH